MSAIPLGQFTCRYVSPTIRPMEEFTPEQVLLTRIRDDFCGGVSAELARRIGKDVTYVNRLFYPAGKKGRKGIGLEVMRACTEAFSLPPGFWEGRDTPHSHPVDVTKYKRIWVIGKGQGGLPDRIWGDSDYPVGASDEYAEVASADPHAFIVPVVGNSMAPRYHHGEFALVEPGTEPDLEDDVLVRLQTGETLIKRLLSRRGGWRFGSYNETNIYDYAADEVSWVYYVAHPVPARKIKSRM